MHKVIILVCLAVGSVFPCVVCTGGVGFDINCGVRLLRTNLFEKDVQPIKEQLAQVRTQTVLHPLPPNLQWGEALIYMCS